ncbi:mid1-interacting protein 1-B-like [Dunckerocampus dactyliophorus]|uniref:mid1-interacting protein 1-B-like n=1 Tax=Dunckerocampus dactyliophorus TaxID=161453 RepID=UPI002406CA9F|nr:mid1-interacting protein 1-B-like [Dunckerocampus dactyliophorus]
MQPASEAKFKRDSLLLALRSYSSAVGRMEQTVLLPNLLRDIPADEPWHRDAAVVDEEPSRDLYSEYLMLKAVKSVVESGLVPLEDKTSKKAALGETLEALLELDADPESLFRFHLRGLHSIMSQLTQRSQRLTQKYLDIIGIAN